MSGKPSHLSFRFELDMDGTHLAFAAKLPDKGICGIYGPSGAGKTTLLRCISGLQRVEKGYVEFAGKIWQNESYFAPAHERPIAYVFQDSRLFDHLNVKANIEYGMRRKGGIDSAGFDQVVSLLGLSRHLQRKPKDLSGGEKQRVAIARAVCTQPEILLMDEPLASLDTGLKEDILCYLEALRDDQALPILYVSHHIEEITRLSDHLLVVESGACKVQGPLNEVLEGPNFLPYIENEPFTLVEGALVNSEDERLMSIDCQHFKLRLPRMPVHHVEKVRLRLYARDISVTLNKAEGSSILNIIPARIKAIQPAVSHSQCLVVLEIVGKHLYALVTEYSREQLRLEPGLQVYAQIKAASLTR